MTAVSDWDTVDPRADGELVRGSLAGDQSAFAQIYDRYSDRLYDFCVGMVRDFDGAADCVQETFVAAATRLHQLREPAKLRPWLYSIARNEALRRLRQQRRETPTDELPDVVSDDDGPDTLSARTELADLISDVAGGLSDRDRAVLDLTYRHGLDGSDLADALGVSHSNANAMVMRLRRTIERSLGALLISRRAQKNKDACAELRGILANWNGQFTVLMRKRVSRHVESCSVCDEERRRLVSPSALLGAAPLFIPAPEWLRERTLGDVQLVSHNSAMDSRADAYTGAVHIGGAGGGRRGRRMLLAGLLIAQLGASAALMLSCNPSPVSIIPADVSEVAPEPSGQTPTPNNPPPAPVEPPPLVSPPSSPAPVVEPTPAVLPPDSAPTDPAPADDQPSIDEPASKPAPPSTKPPMSFTPTVEVPVPAGPELGGGDGGGRRAGSP